MKMGLKKKMKQKSVSAQVEMKGKGKCNKSHRIINFIILIYLLRKRYERIRKIKH